MLDKTYYGKTNFVVQPKIIKLGLRMKSHILKIKLKTRKINRLYMVLKFLLVPDYSTEASSVNKYGVKRVRERPDRLRL